VIGAPPLNVGATQVSPIAVSLVIDASLARELGGSGLIINAPPLPSAEKAELPTSFVAATIA
jgi:hypothetical protein